MKAYLSQLAEFKLELLLNYVEDEWGKSSKDKFLKLLKTSITRISNSLKVIRSRMNMAEYINVLFQNKHHSSTGSIKFNILCISQSAWRFPF
jgi:plasmid stabilization system protein ParE